MAKKKKNKIDVITARCVSCDKLIGHCNCIITDEVSCLEMNDAVNHPSHYGGEHNIYETIKVIEAWGCDFHIGNCIKYLSRAGKKNDELEDLKKAVWYLNRKIKLLEKMK